MVIKGFSQNLSAFLYPVGFFAWKSRYVNHTRILAQYNPVWLLPYFTGYFLPGLFFFTEIQLCLTAVPASRYPVGCFVPFSRADAVPRRFINLSLFEMPFYSEDAESGKSISSILEHGVE
jgi:hypothetical protein